MAQSALDLAIAGPRAEELLQAEAQLRGNEAQLALIRQELDDAELVAPFDAVIRSRLMEPGEMAAPTKPVFSLATIGTKWVRAYVSEVNLGHVRSGMRAKVTSDSFPDRPLDGWVGFISPVAEFTPKTVETEDLRSSLVYEVRVFVEDKDDMLRLGMPATVKLLPDEAPKPLPQNAEQQGNAMTGAAPTNPVTARTIHKSFRRDTGETVKALEGVSFEARQGTLTALVGPDGAGKTTLLRLIAGLMVADSGELYVLGIDVAADPQTIQNRIGYMPQKFGLYEDLSVQQNLDLYADLHGITREQRREIYPRLMEMTDLGRFTAAPCRQAFRRHEAEARPRLHAGACAGTASAGRTDRGRRSAVAARILGDRHQARARGQADRRRQHLLSR